MMLSTLLSQYDIKNWSIYCNNSQNTCVTIRFSDMDGCTDLVQSGQYKRISDKQLARSKARSDAFKQSRNQANNVVDNSTCKKRKCDKMQDCSPELFRVQEDIPDICHIDSPAILVPVKEAQSPAYFKEDHHIEYDNLNTSSTDSHSDTDNKNASADTVDLLDISIPDYHTTHDIEPLTSYQISPTLVRPVDYHIAIHSTDHDILDDKTHINLDPLPVATSLTPSCQFYNGNDNDETLIKYPNVIYCQCCSGVMSVTHVCPIENDPRSPTPPNEIPPDPGPSQMYTPCDVVDPGDPQPDVKDPKLLQILCSVIGKLKK